MLIAEDLLLLLTDDATGQLSAPAAHVDLGLGGANLIELTLMNKVGLSRQGDGGRLGRIVVRDPAPTGDGVLDAALEILVTHQGKKPSTVLKPLTKNLRARLYERLSRKGVIRAEAGKILGVFPTHTWPTRDPRPEAEVRRLVTEALVHQTAPDARTAALIALLHALGCEHKIVDPQSHHLTQQQLRTRAEEIATGDWASEAVRTTIQKALAVVAAGAATSAVVLSGAN